MWLILGILFLAGLVLHYFWWIVGFAALAGLAWLLNRLIAESEEAAIAEAARKAAIIARADQEHQWVMQGDPKGMYSAEAMPTIRKYQQAVA